MNAATEEALRQTEDRIFLAVTTNITTLKGIFSPFSEISFFALCQVPGGTGGDSEITGTLCPADCPGLALQGNACRSPIWGGAAGGNTGFYPSTIQRAKAAPLQTATGRPGGQRGPGASPSWADAWKVAPGRWRPSSDLGHSICFPGLPGW